MKSFPVESKQSSLVALAAALEGHSMLPSRQSLEMILEMKTTDDRKIKEFY